MLQDHPINEVKWVNVEQIQANDYNPNKVASTELKLLYVSIKQDGYTQPIVTFYDKEIDKYVQNYKPQKNYREENKKKSFSDN